MTPPVQHTAQEARDELEKVSSLVLAARRLMAKGALVDLSAIQERVADICTMVASMPRKEARELLEDLNALIGRLDRLGRDITDQLHQVMETSDDDVEPRS